MAPIKSNYFQEDNLYEQRIFTQWNMAENRYNESAKNRQETLDSTKSKSILEIESLDRVNLRESLFEPNDAFALERVIGTNDLLQINYLSRGLKAGRSVCRIHIHRPNGIPEGYGTGFMVSPSLLLTNNHVIPSTLFAKRSLAEFNFEYDENFEPKLTHYFQLSPDKFFYTNRELDFSLISVKPLSKSGTSLSSFDFLQLTESSGKALINERVSVIQHPSGSDKHIIIRNNRIQNRFDNFIHYEADTMPGSSGAPIFNDQWDVVAIHHSGVPRKSNGKIMKVDGTPWRRGDPGHLVDWIANEGVRISSIFNNLKEKRDWSKNEIRVLEEFGTFSNSNLNEVLIKSSGANILLDENYLKRPKNPTTPRLKISELMSKLEDENTTEQDLAPYFTLSDKSQKGIDPLFQINQELVTIDAPELRESALLLNSANWICKRFRQKEYQRQKDSGEKIRIISEGDSWFQYPFILNDIIDHLMAEPDFAILSFGEAGDLIRDIVAKAEFVSALKTEQPHFFLISGGGNDLVAGGGVKNYVKRPTSSLEPHNLIDRIAFNRFKARIANDYTNLFSIVLKTTPNIKILCHGYSYAIPNKGKWLGKPLEEIGIIDHQLQSEIVRILFDELNDVIQRTAASFPDSIHYLDLRDIVPPRGWFDELHPTNPFYGDIASLFKDKILELNKES